MHYADLLSFFAKRLTVRATVFLCITCLLFARAAIAVIVESNVLHLQHYQTVMRQKTAITPSNRAYYYLKPQELRFDNFAGWGILKIVIITIYF